MQFLLCGFSALILISISTILHLQLHSSLCSSISLFSVPSSICLVCFSFHLPIFLSMLFHFQPAVSIIHCSPVHLHPSLSSGLALGMFLQIDTSPSALQIFVELFQSPPSACYNSSSTLLKLQLLFPVLDPLPPMLCSSPCSFSQQEASRRASRGLGLHSVSEDSAGGEPGQARGGESQEAGLAKTHTLLAFWQGGVAWRNDPI